MRRNQEPGTRNRLRPAFDDAGEDERVVLHAVRDVPETSMILPECGVKRGPVTQKMSTKRKLLAK